MKAVVVATETGTYPCGGCRQVMAEFVGIEKVPVFLIKSKTREILETSVQEILPGTLEICYDK